jgi:hypothetical protein
MWLHCHHQYYHYCKHHRRHHYRIQVGTKTRETDATTHCIRLARSRLDDCPMLMTITSILRRHRWRRQQQRTRCALHEHRRSSDAAAKPAREVDASHLRLERWIRALTTTESEKRRRKRRRRRRRKTTTRMKAPTRYYLKFDSTTKSLRWKLQMTNTNLATGRPRKSPRSHEPARMRAGQNLCDMQKISQTETRT